MFFSNKRRVGLQGHSAILIFVQALVNHGCSIMPRGIVIIDAARQTAVRQSIGVSRNVGAMIELVCSDSAVQRPFSQLRCTSSV
eukprot:3758311-Amphidinium_carterae.1